MRKTMRMNSAAMRAKITPMTTPITLMMTAISPAKGLTNIAANPVPMPERPARIESATTSQ